MHIFTQWYRLRAFLGRSEAHLIEKCVAQIEDNWTTSYGEMSRYLPNHYRQFVMAFGYPTIAIDGTVVSVCRREAIRLTNLFKVETLSIAVCSPQNIYVGCFVQPAGTRGSYF